MQLSVYWPLQTIKQNHFAPQSRRTTVRSKVVLPISSLFAGGGTPGIIGISPSHVSCYTRWHTLTADHVHRYSLFHKYWLPSCYHIILSNKIVKMIDNLIQNYINVIISRNQNEMEGNYLGKDCSKLEQRPGSSDDMISWSGSLY